MLCYLNNNMTYTFSSKWADVAQKDNENSDEKSIFVNIGDVPVTQRQLDLYYYFLFIKNILNKINAKKLPNPPQTTPLILKLFKCI